MSSYSSQHLAGTAEIVQKLDPEALEKMADLLTEIRNRGGRLFFLGVGGSAANASQIPFQILIVTPIDEYRFASCIKTAAVETGHYSVKWELLRKRNMNCLHHLTGQGSAADVGLVGRYHQEKA
jgi:hypothetical protein